MVTLEFETSSISLQEFMEKPLVAILDPYFQIHQELPVLSGSRSMPAIPIIDMESFSHEGIMALELEKLHSTCKEWGVFQVNFAKTIHAIISLSPFFFSFSIFPM